MQIEERFAIKQRRVYIVGEVEQHLVKKFIEYTDYYLAKGHDPIYVLLDSEGGDVYAQVAVTDQIESLKKYVDVYTIGLSHCYSAATSILIAGTKGKRFARPQTSIMLHPCSYGLEADYAGNQEKLSKFMQIRIGEINRNIARYCGKGGENSYKKFLKDIDKGLWLSAQEAMKYGVIDGIIEELPRTYVGEIKN